MTLDKHSLGIGDRFGREGVFQLRALQIAAGMGVNVTPVWNKSNREHTLIGTRPEDVRRVAEQAVKTAGWGGQFFVDADHVGISTVDRFLTSCNYYTIDVAEQIGTAPPPDAVDSFLNAMGGFCGVLEIPGVAGSIVEISAADALVLDAQAGAGG